jgi:hypothetical protein
MPAAGDMSTRVPEARFIFQVVIDLASTTFAPQPLVFQL